MPTTLEQKAVRVPPGLPGGFEFFGTFEPVPFTPGQVWRKRFPCDSVFIESVQLPGAPGYDDSLPGLSVRFVESYGGGLRWSRRWFMPGTAEQLHREFQSSGRVLVQPSTPKPPDPP